MIMSSPKFHFQTDHHHVPPPAHRYGRTALSYCTWAEATAVGLQLPATLELTLRQAVQGSVQTHVREVTGGSEA